MVKDRLHELKRAQFRSHYSISMRNYSRGALEFGYYILSNHEYVEDFLYEATLVRGDINWIRENVNTLNVLHNKIIADPVVNTGVKKEAEDVTCAIQQKARKVQSKIKDFENDYLREQKENPTSAQLRIIDMQRSTLTQDLVDVMTDYNAVQLKFRECLKNRFKRQLEIAGQSTTNEELEDLFESGESPAILTREIKMHDVAKAKIVLAELEDRHREIMDLEKSILELHGLFVDMSVLVVNQGDLINHIEENVKRAVDYCIKGKLKTKKASTYANRHRKKFIIIAVFCILVLALIIGIIVAFAIRRK